MRKTSTFVVLILLAALSAWAGRKVTIPIQGGLTLTNTSNASVTYNLTCKDKDGAHIPALAKTGETLTAGKTAVPLSSSFCAAGKTEITIDGFAPQMKSCEGSFSNFANALTNACSPNHTPCTITEFISYKGTANSSGTMVHMRAPTDGTWSIYGSFHPTYTDGWTDVSDGNNTYYASAKIGNYSIGIIADGLTGSGNSDSTYEYYRSDSASSLNSLLCCGAASGTPTQCEVEITSGTGHLSSPQFLGGKAF